MTSEPRPAGYMLPAWLGPGSPQTPVPAWRCSVCGNLTINQVTSEPRYACPGKCEDLLCDALESADELDRDSDTQADPYLDRIAVEHRDARRLLELAGRAAYEAFRVSASDRLGVMPPWDAIPPEAQADWRAVADAALAILDEIGDRQQ